MKIKTKLTVTHVLIALLCSLLIAIPTVKKETELLKTDVQEKMDLQLENIYSQVSAFVDGTQDLIKSCSDHFSNFTEYNLEEGEEFLINAVNNNPLYQMIYFSSAQPIPDGGFLFNNIHWRAPLTFDQTSREWFKATKKSRDSYFAVPYIDELTGSLVVTTSRGVFNKNGYAGAIGADFTIDKLKEFVEKMKISKSGISFFITPEGQYITNDETKKILKDNFYVDFGIEELKGEVLKNEKIIKAEYGNYYFASRKMPEITKWTFVTIGPRSEIFDTLRQSLTIVLIMFIITILFAVVVGTLISFQIVKPLSRLGNTLQEIASGTEDR